MKVFICLVVLVACVVAELKPCYNDAGVYNGKTVKEVKATCAAKSSHAFFKCAIKEFGVVPQDLEAFTKAVAVPDRVDELLKVGVECTDKGKVDPACADRELTKICSDVPPKA